MALMPMRPDGKEGSVLADVHLRGEAVEQGLEAAFELAGQGGPTSTSSRRPGTETAPRDTRSRKAA